ncbi:Troponin C-like 7, partial [Homarus americanus]
MMGVKISEKNLQEVISEVDEDEEDEESLKTELKEAFRIYDKQGDGYITTQTLKEILRELDNKLTEEDLDDVKIIHGNDGWLTLSFSTTSSSSSSSSLFFLVFLSPNNNNNNSTSQHSLTHYSHLVHF